MNYRRILYWAGLLIGGILFLWQIIRSVQSLITNQVQISSIGFVVLAWTAMVLIVVMQMINWQIILDGLGFSLSFTSIAKGYTLSLLPRYIPGSIWGYLSRSEWLNKDHAIPYHIGNYGSVIDLLVTLTSACSVLGLYNSWISTGYQRILSLSLSLILPVLVWLILYYISRQAVINFGFKKFRNPIICSIPFKNWLECILLFILQWVVLGGVVLSLVGIFYPSREWVSEIVNVISFGKATFSFTLAWTVGFLIIFVPGGMGVREFILSGLVTENFALKANEAILVAVLARIVYSGAEFFWIGLGILLRRWLISGSK